MSVSVRVSRMDSWCEDPSLVAFWEFARGTSPEAVSGQRRCWQGELLLWSCTRSEDVCLLDTLLRRFIIRHVSICLLLSPVNVWTRVVTISLMWMPVLPLFGSPIIHAVWRKRLPFCQTSARSLK